MYYRPLHAVYIMYMYYTPPLHRAILRSVLVFCTRVGLLTSPPVPSPDRKRAQVSITLH